MSNFKFLHSEWPDIFEIAKEAEEMVNTKPLASRMYCRQALEKGINWMFENDSRLEIPSINTLGSLITAKCLKPLLDKSQRRNLILLQQIGNAGVHGRSLKKDESEMLERFSPIENINVNSNKDLAYVSICLLFEFCSFLAISYSNEDIEIQNFNDNLIPSGSSSNETAIDLEQLQKKLKSQLEADQAKRATIEAQANELESLKKELKEKGKLLAKRAASRANKVRRIPQQIPESVTRKLYIDVLLKECGWSNLKDGRDLEYEVKGMPLSTNRTGIGYADYVLWDDNGKPLAVIEAKKTMVDAKKGKHQATLYANCLEQMHGQRPVIFYTNGFETFLWDDTFYVEREVSGFYSKDELQLLIQRRVNRRDLRDFKVNKDICGRPYQLEAIKRVAENLATTHNGRYVGTNRASLLVMATGSGKTRTAAALVDMLTKCNWAKRVLFLADRNALVTQAKNAFNEHLPDLSSIDLTKEKENNLTRLVFSTYPSIMNKIDKEKVDKERFYGTGHFDLIIIDEAHRSVYQKYRAIFEYFDALLLGLTATPKKDIDRNTYGLFGIEDDDPTFAYELDQAVKDEFLVPPKAISVPLKFQREGIKYHELSEEEKEEYEEKFGDPTSGEVPEEIGSSAVNKWLFNTDTVDKVLDHLMTSGIKVEGGDKLGKTIIFAKNHQHAEFIEKRFNKNYPEYGGHFLRVIDNYESKAQDLLEKFCDQYVEQDPQIAVSVDMMDTGVDAPKVVNLVFFKMVKSSTKFWQMIGRGTRLCPNLFGPDDHKKEFIIFDYCQNFEFFDEYPDGAEGKTLKPLLQQIFEAKLKVAYLIGELPSPTAEETYVRELYLNELHKAISQLDEERFIVRKQLRFVKAYSNLDKWMSITKNDILDINKHLSHLTVAPKDDDELARRFDLLMLTYQLALLTGSGDTAKYTGRVFRTAKALEKKGNIPQVLTHLPLIKEVQDEKYWNSINLKKLEELRTALRDLIKYLETQKQQPVYTHFIDEIDLDNISVNEPISTYTSLQSYRDRVEKYVRDNKHHLTISKLRTNIPITKEELNELEKIFYTEDAAVSKSQFENEYNNIRLGVFVRNILGMDKEAAQDAFSNFIQSENLSGNQITFVDTIISYLTKNGTIDKSMLFEPPFTNINDQGLLGVFDDVAATKIISIVDEINRNAKVV